MARNYSSVAAESALSAAISSSQTTVQVASVTGFPPAPFTLALDPGTLYEELVTVTSVASTTLTVVRGEDGSSALAHEQGAVVRHVVSARDLREAQEHIEGTQNVHGVGSGSSVVGTNTAQTLKNKTLDGTNSVSSDALPTETTVSRLRITSATDASTSSTTHGLQIGSTSGDNLRIDTNEIVSLNAGAPAPFSLRDNESVLVPEPVGSASAATKGYVDTATADLNITSTTGFGSAASGWTTSSTASTSRLWRQGKLRHLFLELRRTGGQLSPGASGGIANTDVFTLTSTSDRPIVPINAAATYNSEGAGDWGASVTIYPSTGAVSIIALAPDANLLGGAGSGEWSLRIYATWYVA